MKVRKVLSFRLLFEYCGIFFVCMMCSVVVLLSLLFLDGKVEQKCWCEIVSIFVCHFCRTRLKSFPESHCVCDSNSTEPPT